MRRNTSFVFTACLTASLALTARAQIGATWTRVCDISTVGNQATHGPFGEGYDISDNGRFVAFSNFDPLDPRDVNGLAASSYDVYVRDLLLDQTILVSLNAANASAAGGCAGTDSGGPALSSTGRYVAFPSYATTLVAGAAG